MSPELHINVHGNQSTCSEEEDFYSCFFLLYMGVKAIWSCDEHYINIFSFPCSLKFTYTYTGPAGSVVEHPLRDREVVGSNPGRAIPKALKMVPVATLLVAQHYKASTGFSSPNKISHN